MLAAVARNPSAEVARAAAAAAAAAAEAEAEAEGGSARGVLDFSADGVNKSHLVRFGDVAYPTKYYFVDESFNLVAPPPVSAASAQFLHGIISALLSRERFERPVRFEGALVVYPAREMLTSAQVSTFQRALASLGQRTVVNPVQLTVAIQLVAAPAQ